MTTTVEAVLHFFFLLLFVQGCSYSRFVNNQLLQLQQLLHSLCSVSVRQAEMGAVRML